MLVKYSCVGRSAPHTTVFVLDAVANRYKSIGEIRASREFPKCGEAIYYLLSAIAFWVYGLTIMMGLDE